MRQGEQRVEGVALGEVGLPLDPGQVRPRVGLLQPAPELPQLAERLRAQRRDLGASQGRREPGQVCEAEGVRVGQAGSTMAVIEPLQPLLRGSGP